MTAWEGPDPVVRSGLFPRQIGINNVSRLSSMPGTGELTESVVANHRSLALLDGFRHNVLRNPTTAGIRNCLTEIGIQRTTIGPEQTGLRKLACVNQIQYR